MKFIRRCFLALALVLLLSAGAAAAEISAFAFKDWNDIDNQSQVALLTSLGLFGGYADNSFRPDNNITREEIAKIVSQLQVETVPEASSSSFLDTANSWAGNYIEYCAKQKILTGYNGYFRPKDYMTARELAKCLLVVLGQDSSRYVGQNWSQAVDDDAEEMGLYNGYTISRDLYVTRQQACLMICNALRCPVLVRQEDGDRVYVLDSLMEPMTLLQYRFDVTPVTGIIEANSQADLRDGTPLGENLIHISGYHKDFLVSKEVANDMSLLGRNVSVYAKFSQDQNYVYGLPSPRQNVGYTGENLRPEELDLVLEYGNLKFNSDTEYYFEYNPISSGIMQLLKEEDRLTIFDYEGDGIIDRVLVVRLEPDPCPEETEEPTESNE